MKVFFSRSIVTYSNEIHPQYVKCLFLCNTMLCYVFVLSSIDGLYNYDVIVGKSPMKAQVPHAPRATVRSSYVTEGIISSTCKLGLISCGVKWSHFYSQPDS